MQPGRHAPRCLAEAWCFGGTIGAGAGPQRLWKFHAFGGRPRIPGTTRLGFRLDRGMGSTPGATRYVATRTRDRFRASPCLLMLRCWGCYPAGGGRGPRHDGWSSWVTTTSGTGSFIFRGRGKEGV